MIDKLKDIWAVITLFKGFFIVVGIVLFILYFALVGLFGYLVANIVCGIIGFASLIRVFL